MDNAPKQCPRCGNKATWGPIETNKKRGYNVTEASIGILLLGPLSLIAPAFGRKKKRAYYYCEECGYEQEYKRSKK